MAAASPSPPLRILKNTVLAAALAVAGACVPPPTPVETWQTGNQEQAYTAQVQAVQQAAEKDAAVERLRLASMAYAMGKTKAAEANLRAAVATMTDFQADGEFAAILGAEDKKEWKGEPYEKMSAYLMLGVLLHSAGDRGNALAMYKSAILADTGTKEERYRSDFIAAWVMQAVAFAAEGERGNADQALERAINAQVSRQTLSHLTSALRGVQPAGGVSSRALDQARALLLSALPGGVSAKPRSPAEAARATVSWATDLARVQRELPKKQRLPGLQGFSSRDFDEALEALGPVAKQWRTEVDQAPDRSGPLARQLDAQLRSLLDDPPPVVLLIEKGRGPRKIRTGDYGEVLTIIPSRAQATPPVITVSGGDPTEALYLDSVSYQATTRGGRAVDGFLRGKAVYKDASMITAFALDLAGDIADAAGNSDLGLVADLFALGAAVSSLATNPAADIRAWELIPEHYFIVGIDAEPGDHTLTVDNRRYALQVPARGQAVHLIPALHPGGPTTLGRTQ